jgi:hypothetical protein
MILLRGIYALKLSRHFAAAEIMVFLSTNIILSTKYPFNLACQNVRNLCKACQRFQVKKKKEAEFLASLSKLFSETGIAFQSVQ